MIGRKIYGIFRNLPSNLCTLHLVNIKFRDLDDEHENERDCSLFLDEMKIVECRDFDSSSGNFFGSSTLPAEENVDVTHGLVVMLGGIKVNWKQFVAYNCTAQVNPTSRFEI